MIHSYQAGPKQSPLTQTHSAISRSNTVQDHPFPCYFNYSMHSQRNIRWCYTITRMCVSHLTILQYQQYVAFNLSPLLYQDCATPKDDTYQEMCLTRVSKQRTRPIKVLPNHRKTPGRGHVEKRESVNVKKIDPHEVRNSSSLLTLIRLLCFSLSLLLRDY